MEPRRTPARRAGLAAVAALLVFGASACSGTNTLVGQSPAATVNGTDISQAQVDDMARGSKALLEAQIQSVRASVADEVATGAAPPETSEQLETEIEAARAPFERGTDTYSTAGAAKALTELITSQVYEDAAAEAGAEITDEDRDQAEQQLSGQPGWAEAPELVRDTYISVGAANSALQRLAPQELRDAVAEASDAYEAQLQQVYEQQQASFTQACAYVIQTADEAAATQAADRIRAGEDVAAVAGEVAPSEDGSPAEPQCQIPLSDITEAFGADASTEKGTILGPLSGANGSVVLVVDSTSVQPYEQVRETLAGGIEDQFTQQAQGALDQFVLDLVVEHADVTVDPRFGTWDGDAQEVVPPVPPATPTTKPTGSTTTTVPVAPVAGS